MEENFQEAYDDAMFAFSQGDYEGAAMRFRTILQSEPAHLDARLALGMACYRLGDYAGAIEEGHKAEKLSPHEQLVHTNLSLYYMKAGEKQKAEHHGLQARIASWREEAKGGSPPPPVEGDLQMARPKPAPVVVPEMPWKKNKSLGSPQAAANDPKNTTPST